MKNVKSALAIGVVLGLLLTGGVIFFIFRDKFIPEQAVKLEYSSAFDITTNLADQKRYIKLTVQLAGDKKSIEKVNEKAVVVLIYKAFSYLLIGEKIMI